MRDELIQLVTVTESEKNERGFLTGETEKRIEVFASVLSVTGTEFYEAQRNGYEAKIIFAVDPDDYEMVSRSVDGKKKNPSKIIWKEQVYKVIRTYKVKNKNELQITCEEAS